MNRNNTDNNTEAVKIANALKPFAKKWFDEWGQSCVRSKKMTVSTAPNGSVIGVKDAFSDTEVFVKYMSSCSKAVVGDTVWCKWMYDNMQTLYADSMGNLDEDTDINYVPITGGTFTGDVTFEGSINANGSIDTSYGDLSKTGNRLVTNPSAVSVATSTWKTVASLAFTTGVWVVFGTTQWESNSTGRRRAILSTLQDSSDNYSLMTSMEIKALNDGSANTYVNFASVISLSSSTTLYMNAWQNSGSTLSTTGRFYAVRIA